MGKKLLCMMLALLVLGLFAGCSHHSGHARSDMPGGTAARLLPNPPAVPPEPKPEPELDLTAQEKAAAALADLAVQMLQEAMAADEKQPENTLLSPVSLTYALGMTANGAQGETLTQLEKVLGLSCAELNQYMASLLAKAGEADDADVLHLANSIWFRSEPEFAVRQEFLQLNQDCYQAELFALAFDDKALGQINGWVSRHTKGMIPQILTYIPKDAVMYIINALAFEAEWDVVYEPQQIRLGVFTAANGKLRDVQMMYGTDYVYLEEEQAVGFIKYYKGQDYAFAALLPAEGVAIQDYVAELSGQRLRSLLAEARHIKVRTALPQFKCDYSRELNDILQKMGVQAAFDPDLADFSGIGNYDGWPLYINRILQKCHIEVDAKGAKAVAATVVEMDKATSAAPVEEIKYIYLDRPFVYLLLDCRHDNLPLFIGVTADITE